MELVAEGVGVDGAHGPLLAPTSLVARSGEVTLVAGMPGAGHTALALALAGRLFPTTGRVLLDRDPTPSRRRRAVAAVDVPGVSEPDESLPLRTVIGEDLAMAGRAARPGRVVAWLAEHDADRYAGLRWEHVPAPVRLSLLGELAAARPGVEAVVLCTPDRHGGPPEWWWHEAWRIADGGPAVVVTCLEVSARVLEVAPVVLGGSTS